MRTQTYTHYKNTCSEIAFRLAATRSVCVACVYYIRSLSLSLLVYTYFALSSFMFCLSWFYTVSPPTATPADIDTDYCNVCEAAVDNWRRWLSCSIIGLLRLLLTSEDLNGSKSTACCCFRCTLEIANEATDDANWGITLLWVVHSCSCCCCRCCFPRCYRFITRFYVVASEVARQRRCQGQSCMSLPVPDSFLGQGQIMGILYAALMPFKLVTWLNFGLKYA